MLVVDGVAFVVAVQVAVRLPTAEGVKINETVHVPPAERLPPQVLPPEGVVVKTKSPGLAPLVIIEFIVVGSVPPLVQVATTAADETFIG